MPALNPKEPILDRKAMTALGDKLHALLAKSVPDKQDRVEKPFAVASMYTTRKRDGLSMRDPDFEAVVNSYVAQIVEGWFQPCEKLFDKMTKIGHTSKKTGFAFTNDARVWACAQQRGAKAFALNTETRNYLVVLESERPGRQALHIRRYWDLLSDLREEGGYLPLQDIAERKDLTLEDVIKLASEAAERYSDCLPDVRIPKRPSLQSFLDSSLWEGLTSSIGLRYGDARDPGYVLTARYSAMLEAVEVRNVISSSFQEIGYVAHNLTIAMDVLSGA